MVSDSKLSEMSASVEEPSGSVEEIASTVEKPTLGKFGDFVLLVDGRCGLEVVWIGLMRDDSIRPK